VFCADTIKYEIVVKIYFSGEMSWLFPLKLSSIQMTSMKKIKEYIFSLEYD
jgi:hypothetical protein